METREEVERPDLLLLERFRSEIKSRVPHLASGVSEPVVENATPLLDMTDDLIDCARSVYGLDISGNGLRVYGKLESSILGGSIKVRPAVQIIEEAIASGRLTGRTTVFEATSGNFGIALGLMRELGLEVVVLVSRRLQEGVIRKLDRAGVKLLNLDVDLCPAPGMKVDPDALAVKAVASGVGSLLARRGFDPSVFEASRPLIEEMLARGDAIALAKHLARIYGGFCPEQYDNELNARAHQVLTGPEIEQQLRSLGSSLKEFEVVCTFGTGGTSAGLSRYVLEKHWKKSVHVVFPLEGQDVAGIRDRGKALGLRFYEPWEYAGQHEVDFEEAKPALEFFVKKGYDIGESSALALCAAIRLASGGIGKKFVVVLADGSQKYRASETEPDERRFEVSVQEASSGLADFGGVLWTHPVFAPSTKGIELLASALRYDGRLISVAAPRDVGLLYGGQEMSEDFRKLLPKDGRKLLLVCMNGSTSRRLAQSLSRMGVDAVSLAGGVAGLATIRGDEASEFVEVEET